MCFLFSFLWRIWKWKENWTKILTFPDWDLNLGFLNKFLPTIGILRKIRSIKLTVLKKSRFYFLGSLQGEFKPFRLPSANLLTVNPVFLSEKSENPGKFEKYENPKINSNDKPEKHEKAEKPAKPRLSGIYWFSSKIGPPKKGSVDFIYIYSLTYII